MTIPFICDVCRGDTHDGECPRCLRAEVELLQRIVEAADAWLDGFRQANQTVMFSEEVFAVREAIHDDAWDQWGQDAAKVASKERANAMLTDPE